MTTFFQFANHQYLKIWYTLFYKLEQIFNSSYVWQFLHRKAYEHWQISIDPRIFHCCHNLLVLGVYVIFRKVDHIDSTTSQVDQLILFKTHVYFSVYKNVKTHAQNHKRLIWFTLNKSKNDKVYNFL